MRKLVFLLSAMAFAFTAAAASPRVVVTEIPSRDAWRVAWEFDRELIGLSFQRGREPFRAETWRIVEPAGARWGEVDGRDAILAAAGTRRVVVELDSDFRLRKKDYHINVAFTDGSRLLYSGHLAALPLERCASCEKGHSVADEGVGDVAWRFETEAGRSVRLLDQAGRGRLDWTPRPGREREDGTYVYFGAIEPVPAASMTLLVDPGMPRWLVEGIRAEFPKMFDFHARLTGTQLDFVPLVLLSYQADHGQGLTLAGGTLEGLAQIAALGKAWETKTPEAERLWFRHLAHEAFHFWDGQMFRADEKSEWLSEAAAEYASFLALRDRGLVDDAQLERALVEECNDCLVLARGMSIAEAPAQGNFDIVYSCGLVTQYLADRAMSSGGKGPGIGALYRELFDPRGDRRYGATEFLRLVAGQGDRFTTAAIATIVNEGVERDFDLFLAEALRNVGVPVTLGAATEAAVSQATARDEVRALIRSCACARGDDDLCKSPDTVVCVDGWSVRSKPERGAVALAEAVERGNTVTIAIGRSAAPRELRCPAASRAHRRLLVLE
ncbi:MAG: hypothetical protein ACSLFQ_11330 [Thermoanaerobaculia bacterium]